MASSLAPTRRLSLIARHLAGASPLRSLSSSPSPTPVRNHSTSSSSPPQRYPYIFTTSAFFHGKPSYRPPTADAQGGKLAQGLPPSHPLVAWRDAQLEGAPKQGAGHDWFFVEGIQREGEGEVQGGLKEGEEGVRGVVMAVADGVGGWEDSGVDPSHFSQALMWFARERVRQAASSSALASGKKGEPWTWPQEEGKRCGAKVRDLLQGAFEDVKKEEGIVAGSSTACIVALDAETGLLHATNLGDSGFLVLRPSAVSTSSPSSETSSSSSDSDSPSHPSFTHSYSLVHSQPPQIHFFNAPYQLSKFPRGEDMSNALLNYPRDADVTNEGIQLEDGDVVLVVTDGFSDNVFDKGEADLLISAVRSKVDAHFQALGKEEGRDVPPGEKDAELASSIARTAVSFARMISVREDKVTPFEVESRRWGAGGKDGFKGGKVDDVTVVVAVVRKVETA
ncbi:hypothetical protein JCM11251_004484 [Rhodosporidiobolus azoricus]